jgi:DNA-binding Lrp family transcriptional regulator
MNAEARSLATAIGDLDEIDRRLLNDFQHDLPLTPAPFAEMAARLGVSEACVMERLRALAERGFVSRIGAVVRPKTIGASTLAALCVPASELDRVADLVSEYAEVNHNYEREHEWNLWFVVTGADEAHCERVMAGIEAQTGLEVLRLPMLADYHIDLGFDLDWARGDRS